MHTGFLRTVFLKHENNPAIIWKGKEFSYFWLSNRIDFWSEILRLNKLANGKVVVLEADFSPNSIALFLALTEALCIVVPLTLSSSHQKQNFLSIAEVETVVRIDELDEVYIEHLKRDKTHPLILELIKTGHPGLILFSSGSTGESKAALHDLSAILQKFKTVKKKLRTITFLLYDHIGGVNTMFYTLSNGGCLITAENRSPNYILKLISVHKVELLPASPTFLNLILISEAYKKYDLSSLKIVTYGTEPMTESTLSRFHGIFPNLVLQQTYGSSEVGILRSKSKSSDSLWVKVGGEGFETKIENEILFIKSQSAMLGYLNAPSPFTIDGWYNTGDKVLTDGEYIRILGRNSELINVGGEKVFPVEVENIILDFLNVAEVTVFGEKNAITGNIVCARISLINKVEDAKAFINELKKHCRIHLAQFKVPVKIFIEEGVLYTERFKKKREGFQG